MNKSANLLIFLSLLVSQTWAQFQPSQSYDSYKVFINVSQPKENGLEVHVVPPLISLEGDSVIYEMARVIPGTYSISNFGQFVQDLKVLDHNGNPLEYQQLTPNRWYVPSGEDVYKFTYVVEETFGNDEADIFEPSGTTFRDSVALLNLFAMVGYMHQHGHHPYELTVQKPREFYGATNLSAEERAIDRDVFHADDYFFLHDNPILYARPDTASVMVDDTRIHLAVFSGANFNSAEDILPDITSLFQATSDYFGGTLPVNDYHILLFFEHPEGAGSRFGALEHHYSTVIFMPDYPKEAIIQNVKDIVAHEFLHIVTPLNFHSEVVHNYDFQYPEMTRHLWLYEGVTEYTSHLVQVRGGLIDEDDFLEEMREKMHGAEEYDIRIPIHTASRYALDVHEDQYLNVYQNGALIAMCLDLQIIASTDGQMDLRDLMVSLSNTFGPDTFFTDHLLFDVIANHGFKGIHEFAAQYIEASLPLPISELLYLFGYEYEEDAISSSISFGITGFGIDMEDMVLVVEDNDEADAVAKALGYQEGDKIMRLNGSSMNLLEIESTITDFLSNAKMGDPLEVVVNRPNKKGTKFKEKTLKTTVQEVAVPTKHRISAHDEYDNENFARLRNVWLRNK